MGYQPTRSNPNFRPPFKSSSKAFIRCDHCENTYLSSEPWCPHCLAARPKGHEWPRTSTATFGSDTITFYSDGEEYVTFYSDGEEYMKMGNAPAIEECQEKLKNEVPHAI